MQIEAIRFKHVQSRSYRCGIQGKSANRSHQSRQFEKLNKRE